MGMEVNLLVFMLGGDASNVLGEVFVRADATEAAKNVLGDTINFSHEYFDKRLKDLLIDVLLPKGTTQFDVIKEDFCLEN